MAKETWYGGNAQLPKEEQSVCMFGDCNTQVSS